MMKREESRIVEIGGRRWKIGRFDALTGSYILTVVLRMVAPVIGVLMPKGFDTPMDEVRQAIDPGLLMQLIPKFDKSEFSSLQRDCLSVCQEATNLNGISAFIPVIMPDGRWGVAGLETDTMTVLMLTIHTLIFNVTGFFDGNAFSDLAESFKGLNLLNART